MELGWTTVMRRPSGSHAITSGLAFVYRDKLELELKRNKEMLRKKEMLTHHGALFQQGGDPDIAYVFMFLTRKN